MKWKFWEAGGKANDGAATQHSKCIILSSGWNICLSGISSKSSDVLLRLKVMLQLTRVLSLKKHFECLRGYFTINIGLILDGTIDIGCTW